MTIFQYTQAITLYYTFLKYKIQNPSYDNCQNSKTSNLIQTPVEIKTG